MQSEVLIIKSIYNIVDSIKPEAMELTSGEGKPTTDREQARAVTFPYFNYGKISVSIMNPNNLLVLVSPNMEDNMSPESKDRYKNFLMKIKKVGDSFPDVKFTVNKVTGDDFQKHLTTNVSSDLQTAKEKELSMNNISEALNPMFGSSRSSYQQLDNIKMIVKHARPVDESIKGSRTRAIKAIYLENSQGERFKLPINNLWAGRAMARHMANSGTLYDTTGQCILEWAGRIGKLQKFAHYAKKNGLINESTADIMNAVTQNIHDAKDILQQLSTQRGYASFNGEIPAAPSINLADERVGRLKETFTVKTFDESLEDALPLIGALIMEKEKDQSGDIFADLPEVMNELKKLIQAKNIDPKVLTAVKANIADPESASQFGIKASKVSSELTGKNDSVSNFLSRMSDILDDYHNKMAFDAEKKDPRFNKALALTQAMVNAFDLGAIGDNSSVSEVQTNSPMEGFKNWANMVVEGVTVSPTSPDQHSKLNELMATPMELGEDGVNSIGSLIGIIEDDSLSGMLSALAEKDSSADARPVIVTWLQTHNMTSILEDETKQALAKDGMEINEGFKQSINESKSKIASLEAKIKKAEKNQGWYGGASGTDLYDRYWKKDLSKMKKDLRDLKKTNEGFAGAAVGGIAGAALGKSPGAAYAGAKLGSMAQDKIKDVMSKKTESKKKRVTKMKESGEAGSAKTKYTGGMHGEVEPTKKQSSKKEHLDAAKYHEDEAKTYTASMNSPKADAKDKEWYKKTIQLHKDKAADHKKAAKQAMNEDASKSAIPADSPINDYKRKDVAGLYNFAHLQHPNGNYIQHNKNTYVHYDKKTGEHKNFDRTSAGLKGLVDHVAAAHNMTEADETAPTAAANIDTEVVKILTQIYNVIKEASPSMPPAIAAHLFNANKNMIAAINAAKTVNESKQRKKKINEAPVGFGQRLGTWARGKAAGALGPLARGWQSQIAGEKEINAAANKLGLEFRKILGKHRIDVNSDKAVDALYNWSKRQGYPVDDPEMFTLFQAAKTSANSAPTTGSGVTSPPTPSASAPTPPTPPTPPTAPTPSAPSAPTPPTPAAAATPAPRSNVPTPPTIDPRAAAQIKPTTNSIPRPGPSDFSDPRVAKAARADQEKEQQARATKNAAMQQRARAKMRENAITEDKKTIDNLIYKLVIRHDQLGKDGTAPMTSTGGGGVAVDLDSLSAKATTPAQIDALAKAKKMLSDQGLI